MVVLVLSKITQGFLPHTVVISGLEVGADSRTLEGTGTLWIRVLGGQGEARARGDGPQNALHPPSPFQPAPKGGLGLGLPTRGL